MSDVTEEIIYNWILIKEDDSSYLGWSQAESMPEASDGFKWVEWGKEVPSDENKYILDTNKHELIKDA